MDIRLTIAAIVLLFMLVVAVFFILKMRARVKELESKYLRIINITAEVEKIKKEKIEVETETQALKENYREKKELFENLVKEVAIYDEEIQLAELGFYKPHFDFDTSEQYKTAITNIKQQQQSMISSKNAIFCTREWLVEGSKSKGQTMTNRNIKLTARAFNNECEAAISSVRWNNVDRMEKRIEKAYESINKLNESNAIIISDEYYTLKLKELRLAYEYEDKKQREKEEQSEIKQKMREEAKLEQEVEQALKQEENYRKILEKAKREAEKATGEKLALLNEQIDQLNQKLEKSHEKYERAKSMAEQTKRGHVYVVSNIGSFGKHVYKIGMTRRLEPLERVKELGNASVPFSFDIHAMIYSEDAPALENELHKKFDHARINLANPRKEFFRVSLADIERVVKKISPNAEFIKTVEARDFRESLSIIAQRKNTKSVVGWADARKPISRALD